jgi:hypothetical protein
VGDLRRLKVKGQSKKGRGESLEMRNLVLMSLLLDSYLSPHHSALCFYVLTLTALFPIVPLRKQWIISIVFVRDSSAPSTQIGLSSFNNLKTKGRRNDE